MTNIVKHDPAATLADLSEKELVKRIRETGQKSDHHYQHSVAWSILQGVYLAHAKETVVHGNFQKWIKSHFPDISYEVANRNRKLAVAIRDKLAKSVARDTFEPREILMLPRLPKARREAILAQIEDLTDGKSLRQLYHDYEVLRLSDRRGGKRSVASHEPTEEEILAGIRDYWNSYMTISTQYIEEEEQSWAQLPAIDRDMLLGILEPFVKKLKSSLGKNGAAPAK